MLAKLTFHAVEEGENSITVHGVNEFGGVHHIEAPFEKLSANTQEKIKSSLAAEQAALSTASEETKGLLSECKALLAEIKESLTAKTAE